MEKPGLRERKVKKLSFQEQLKKAVEADPALKQLRVTERDAYKEEVASRDKAVADKELDELFAAYGLSVEKLDIRKEGSLFSIPVTEHFTADRLPPGYGYKGGAARALLLRALRVDAGYMPRDVDIVRFSEMQPFRDADQLLARKYMPDDYAFGDGVERIFDRDQYFAERDFTINEVLATDTTIVATKECILDTIRHIIRLTDYEQSRFSGLAGDKMLAKALRFYAEGIHRYGDSEVEGIGDWQLEKYFINPFWLAVQLDRAYEHNPRVAQNFVDTLRTNNQLPSDITTIEEAARYILYLMGEDSFYYRFAPVAQFEREDDWVDEEGL